MPDEEERTERPPLPAPGDAETWDAGAAGDLPDVEPNPIEDLARLRQRPRARLALLGAGVLTLCWSLWAPALLAPALAAATALHDRRTGILEQVRLTALTPREVVTGWLRASLGIPLTLLVTACGVIALALVIGYRVREGDATDPVQGFFGCLVVHSLPAAGVACAMAVGGLLGIRAALGIRDGLVAAGIAYALFLVLEGVFLIVAAAPTGYLARMHPYYGTPYDLWFANALLPRPFVGPAYMDNWFLGGTLFLGLNLLAAMHLRRCCERAVRWEA